MKYLIFILLITACKVPCDDPASLASKTSNVIIDKWECKNKDVVKSDVSRWMAGHNFCEESKRMTGMVSDIVCPLIADFLRTKIANKVPVSWGCNYSLIGKDAANTFAAFCEVIPY